MSPAAIELHGVTKQFGPKVALREVSFEVPYGSCYGLIGPNGAGKTTAFSLICGFLSPSRGNVTVLGQRPSQPGVLKGRMGALPQDAALPPQCTVGRLLSYWARLSGLENPQREARNVLDRVGLSETYDVRAGSLSHGMAKRVALAQALVGRPPIVLLDEPTAGLDPKMAASVRDLVRSMKGHHTLVVSSHNLHELEELCDATAVLDRGALVTSATMAEMTSSAAEFTVQVARGEVPLAELTALAGVRAATLRDGALVLSYDGNQVSPEEIISGTIRVLLDRGVLITGVARGRRLEQRVLELT